MIRKQGSVLNVLLLLTILFISAQALFLAIRYNISGFDSVFYAELKQQLSIVFGQFQLATLTLTAPLSYYIFAQLFLYSIYIYLLWYLTLSVSHLFSLKNPRYLAIFLWCASVALILTANAYFVPHSFFSTLVLNAMQPTHLENVFIICMVFWVTIIALAIVDMSLNFHARHATVLFFILALVTLFALETTTSPNRSVSAATESKPNIFIIGFDALRPDYLSYFNKQRKHTPNFDNFLQSSVVFSDTLTPDARTFPSWVSILSSKYPLHNHARDDNIDLASLNLGTILTKQFKQLGYTTVYASDDNRFNNINNQTFGFDSVIGPSGNAIDFFVSGLNDFPLSNLIIPLAPGKILFPSLNGSHASPHTYDPYNFIDSLATQLPIVDKSKPILFAAHFNITGWPFYYYNDQQSFKANTLALYKNTVAAADTQLGNFLQLLKDNGLLDHAIFVLMSDHGITLELPGDRIISEALYQGNKNLIKVKRAKYGSVKIMIGASKITTAQSEDKIIYLNDKSLLNDPVKLIETENKLISPFNPDLYGVDTSWGYGNDVLSLKQHHPLLAFKVYGTSTLPAHHVAGRSLLLDIAPTLTDILNLPPVNDYAGISLKNYLVSTTLNLSDQRTVYLESSFTPPEIEHDNISLERVLLQSMPLYQVNAKTGLLAMSPDAVKIVTQRKQRAIIQGDWLLAYYPSSNRIRMGKYGQFENYIYPPYAVLVNLKTGKWTTDLKNSFVQTANLADLNLALEKFYGVEMQEYKT